MQNSSEQIEAKLAAYIDGELQESDRAEIEAHLVANPEHRALIEELRGHRLLIAGLPREKAPIDMSEMIEAQLERSVLLDRIEDAGAEPVLRIDRWKQWRAIAAVLLLTGSLSYLVYTIFPKSGAPAEFATLKQADPLHSPTTLATEDASKDVVPTLVPPPDFTASVASAAPDASKPLASITAAPSPVTPAPIERAGGGFDIAASQGGATDELSRVLSLPASGASVTLLVTTDDTAVTSRQVAQFFDENKIDFAPVSKQELAADQEPGKSINLADLRERLNTQSAARAANQSFGSNANQSQAPGQGMLSNSVTSSSIESSPRRAIPGDADLTLKTKASDAAGEGVESRAVRYVARAADNVYVARGVSRSKLAELNTQITQARANQRAEVVDAEAEKKDVSRAQDSRANEPGGQSFPSPATQPASSPLGNADKLEFATTAPSTQSVEAAIRPLTGQPGAATELVDVLVVVAPEPAPLPPAASVVTPAAEPTTLPSTPPATTSPSTTAPALP